jgi:hypothetical protein
MVRVGRVYLDLAVAITATAHHALRPPLSRGRQVAQFLGQFGLRQLSHGGGFLRDVVIIIIARVMRELGLSRAGHSRCPALPDSPRLVERPHQFIINVDEVHRIRRRDR